MITIDGSRGEGGGQILRSSLTLSLLTGQPVRIVQIRAGRKKPGLGKQHLAAVEAAAQIGRAKVEGATLGSGELSFEPCELCGGEYRFTINSAGSCMLVLQTVLLPLLHTAEPTELLLEGGTHNPFAPPFDFLDRVFLPLLRRMGAKVEMELLRPGFYPAGGGKVRVRIQPLTGKLQPLDLTAPLTDCVIREVADYARAKVWMTEVVSSCGFREIFTVCSERGETTERVRERLTAEVADYRTAGALVGSHLADQLLLPLAVGSGGIYRTGPLTEHTRTNMAVIRTFLPTEITTQAVPGNQIEIEVKV